MSVLSSLTGRITGHVAQVEAAGDLGIDPYTSITFHSEGEPGGVILHQPADGTPADLAQLLRVLADGVDLQWWRWLDEHATTYRLDDSTGYFGCCNGFFEHFDDCTIRADIDAARRSLARLDVALEQAVNEAVQS